MITKSKPRARVVEPAINLDDGDFVLHLSCFWIDVDGGGHLSWKFVLSGQEYAKFLMEPMRKLENARLQKANTAV